MEIDAGSLTPRPVTGRRPGHARYRVAICSERSWKTCKARMGGIASGAAMAGLRALVVGSRQEQTTSGTLLVIPAAL